MVRPAKVGRSRGCQPCRQRRIKCDLTEPKCDRCVESGRTCPGPLTGVLFLASRSTPTGKLVNKLIRPEPMVRSTASPNTSELSYDISVFRPHMLVPASDAALLVKSLEFLAKGASPCSWIFKLRTLKDHPHAHALRSSLRALSLAHAAHATNDISVRYDAYRHYGHSLGYQRSSMTLPNVCDDIPTACCALLAMVVLSYFELVTGITSIAWLEHTAAAERLMVMLGPALWKHKLLNQLFFSVRNHSLLRAVIYGQYSAFGHPTWHEKKVRAPCRLQPRSRSRNSYDAVVELMLEASHAQHCDQPVVAAAQWNRLFGELQALHEDFIINKGLSQADAPLLRFNVSCLQDSVGADPKDGFHPGLKTQFSAMALCYFHAATIYLLSGLLQMTGLNYDLSYNANTIIAAGTYLSLPGGSNGLAVIRMILPFSCIWRFVPDDKLRWQGRRLFQHWSLREGLGGSVGIAFPNMPHSALSHVPQLGSPITCA